MVRKKLRVFLLAAVVCMVLFARAPQSALAASEYTLSKGQTVYVPVYSNIFTAPKEVPIHLANTLTIRNTDIHNPILVRTADYYDTKGVLLKRYYLNTVTLAPLETTYIYLSERDQEGGIGANFIIRWHAAKEVNVPIIECLMAGTEGRAFVSPGQVVKEDTK